jgi:hypothetical protein
VTDHALRRLQVLGRVLAVIAAGLWFVLLASPNASASAKGAASGSTSATTITTTPSSASCPADARCATIPANCPKGTTCPEVIASPAVGLGTDQAVFLSMKNFKPSDPIYIYYCSNSEPLSSAGSVTVPLCMLNGTSGIPYPDVGLIASPEGTASYPYTLSPDANNGNVALTAKVPGTQVIGSFFCDNASNPCSLDVSDPYIGTDGTANYELSPSNTAVVPLSYATQSTGCGTGTPIFTDSEFGIESLFPIAAQLDCSGKSPVVGINTAIDSLSAAQSVAALVSGAGFGSDVAFVDDANAPDVTAALAPLKGQYAFIPVALSANVIGFKAIMASVLLTGRYFPDNTFELTPTMAAGLLTDYYSNLSIADVANCGPQFGGNCPLLGAVNEQSGFRLPAVFAAYVRSDTTSSTSQLFSWICSAPKVPVYLGSYKVSDPNVASEVLLTGLNAGLKLGAKPLTKCPTSDQFPTLTRAGFWSAVNSPVKQAEDVAGLSGFVPPPNVGSVNGGVAAFAPMNWTEADYNGLLPAALQNAAGKFVAPSTASLDAAVAGATVNKNGTITPNFNNKNPAAYPLPEVWYALVPTGTLGEKNAVYVRTLLDNLLSLTGGAQTSHLPAGFAPLPATVYRQAVAEVAKYVVGPPPPTTTTTTTTSRTTSTSTTTTTTFPAVTTTTSLPMTTTSVIAATSTTIPKTPPTTAPKSPPTTAPKVTPTTTAFQNTAFNVMGRSDSWLVPAFVSMVAAAFLFGPALLLKSRRRIGGVT